MTTRTLNNGAGSRSLLQGVQHPDNVYARIRNLEHVTDWPSGGPTGGGDPNFGFPPEVPQIVTASPVTSWDGHDWHLGISLTVAYNPPPDFLYLDLDFDGPLFHANFHRAPFAATFTVMDLGFALGGTYAVKVRGYTRNKGPSDWSDPFTGLYFAQNPLVPPTPTNLRFDPLFNNGYTYRYTDQGVEVGLMWDYAGETPDWWHIHWWRVGDEANPIYWDFPGGNPPEILVQGLARLQSYHFEVAVERGGYTSPISTPFLPTIPVENPAPPTNIRVNTTDIPPYGFIYTGRDTADAGLRWDLPTDGLNDQIHVRWYQTSNPAFKVDWYFPGTYLGAYVQGVQTGQDYTFEVYARDRWGYESQVPTVWHLLVPAPIPPAPVSPRPDTTLLPPVGYQYESPSTGGLALTYSAPLYTPAPGGEIAQTHIIAWVSDSVVLVNTLIPAAQPGMMIDNMPLGVITHMELHSVTTYGIEGPAVLYDFTIPLPLPLPPSAMVLNTASTPPLGYGYSTLLSGWEDWAWTDNRLYNPPPGGEIAFYHVRMLDAADHTVADFANLPRGWGGFRYSTAPVGTALRVRTWAVTTYGIESSTYLEVSFTLPVQNPPAPTGFALDTTTLNPPYGYGYDGNGPFAGLVWNSPNLGYTAVPGADIVEVDVWVTDTVRNDIWYVATFTDLTVLRTWATALLRNRGFVGHIICRTSTGGESQTPGTVSFTIPNESPAPAAPSIVRSGVNEMGGWFNASWAPQWWPVSAWILAWTLHSGVGLPYRESFGPYQLQGTENRNMLAGTLYDVSVAGVSADGTTVITSGTTTVTIPKVPQPAPGGVSDSLIYSYPDQSVAGWDVQSQSGSPTYSADTSVVLSGGATLKLTVSS